LTTNSLNKIPESKQAMIVLGMHRSGTSAMAGALSCMGVHLGTKLMTAVKGENEKGYFEHIDIVNAHERLLAHLGYSWDDIRLLPDQWWQLDSVSHCQKELLDIVQRDFSHAKVWALKDPRLCRLLPLWNAIFESMALPSKFVFIFRHPEEVAMSLHHRDAMSLSQGYLLWMEHVLEAEISSRGKARAFVHYDDLLQDSHQVMKTLSVKLDVDWPVAEQEAGIALDNLISPSMQHCHTLNDDAPEDVQCVYEILLSAVEHGEISSDNLKKLDAFRNGLQINSAVVRSLIASTNKDMVGARIANEEVRRLNDVEQHLRTVVAEKNQQLHIFQTHCNEFEKVVQQRDAHIVDLNADVRFERRRDAT